MTNKEKTFWLGRYRRAVAQQHFLEDELTRLREAILHRDAGEVPRVDGDRLPCSAKRIEQAEQKLEKQAENCLLCRLEVAEAVSRVVEPDRQEVLRRRYLLGQSYTQISDEMNLVERRIYQLHRAALGELELGEGA